MFKWITSNPLYAGIILLVAIAGIAGFFGYLNSKDKRHDNSLVNQGAIEERSQGQAEVINHVSTAQNAADRPTGDQLNVVCAKYDRNCPAHGQ